MKHARTLAGVWVFVLAFLGTGVLAPSLGAAQPEDAAQSGRAPEIETDRWYEVWISGARAGWSHEFVTRAGDQYTTRSQMKMQLGRAEQAVTIEMRSEFVESTRGEPIEIRVEHHLGPTPMRMNYRFEGEKVQVETTQSGQTVKAELDPPPGEWLTPQAASRYVAQRLASGATDVTIRVLDTSQGMVVTTVTRSDIKPGEAEVEGETIECLVADTRTLTSTTPVTGREWMAEDGTTLRSEVNLGGMDMLLVASTRERALESFEPPEVLVSSFVTPDRPIERPRRTRRAVYVIGMDDEMPEIPESGYQSVERLDDGRVRVTVDVDAKATTEGVDPVAHLARTTYADTDDALIRDLVERALVGTGDDPMVRAQALRRFVFDHIDEKDFGTAFATASEVARSCQGDCSEHGVLLAAMLRAAGIPSRVAVGVIYVEQLAGAQNAFGYHMWTQALIDLGDGPVWVDLDATLPETFPYDATHIALATSDLAEGRTIQQLAAISPMLGALRIEVEEVR